MPQVHVAVPHLWIIATEPLPKSNLAIIVNMTSLQPHSDTTLTLSIGDHPFVVKPTVINFGDCLVTDVRRIAEGIDLKMFPVRDPCSAALLARIQAGLLQSPRTPFGVKRFLRSNFP